MSIDFETAREAISMTAVAEQYTSLKRIGGEWHGPCPLCGIAVNDGFMVFRDDEKCFCRRCDFRGDAFDLVAKKEGITPIEALERLTGLQLPRRTPSTDDRPDWREQCWQDAAVERIQAGTRAMVQIEGGASPGWKYLTGRGLTPATLRDFEIGFDSRRFDVSDKSKRPAILIPWRLANGLVCALKYRFVDDLGKADRNRRFTQTRGSAPFIFGSNHCKGNDLLICIEGELNAMSVYQAKPEVADVLSFGGDSTGTRANSDKGIRAAYEFAKERGYKQVVIWCDSEDRAKEAGAIFIGIPHVLMQSPRGLDANDILTQHGAQTLWGVIEGHLSRLPQKYPDAATLPVAGIPTTDVSTSVELRAQARGSLDRIFRHADEGVKVMLHELDALIFRGEKKDAQRAVALAEQIKEWCMKDEALEGKELLAAAQKIFLGRAA